MRLHNTLTKKIDDFQPIDGQTARIYSCGPTVYNHAHIGNLSAYIYADILRRTVALAGYNTKHVMNFTDVDDKTIRDSKIDYPNLMPADALKALTNKYEDIFLSEMRAVGNDVNKITFVKATNNIAKMQALINRLLEQGIAYLADDGIYFSIKEYTKTRQYGQLSHINTATISQERIENDEYDKDQANDFALWKKQKPGEPAWDYTTPDGTNMSGRPGWHIECSVMSTDNLGQPFDIHTGGIDLIFPHHENEIAQSTAGDQPVEYAKFFVHNEHLLVNGKKMSKSAHNFYTLPDIEKRGYDPLDFRMLILQSHYRSASNFSWENLSSAKNRRHGWLDVAALRHQLTDKPNSAVSARVNGILQKATESLTNDLDTPNALKYIDEAMSLFDASDSTIDISSLDNLINFVDDNLGLMLCDTSPNISSGIAKLIASRTEAKKTKDYKKADTIRNELLDKGITLLDTKSGVIWQRV